MQMWEGNKKYFQLSLWKGSEAKQKVGFLQTPKKYLYKESLYVKTFGCSGFPSYMGNQPT